MACIMSHRGARSLKEFFRGVGWESERVVKEMMQPLDGTVG